MKYLFIVFVIISQVAVAEKESQLEHTRALDGSNNESLIDLTNEELPPYQSPVVLDDDDDLEIDVEDEFPILPTSIWSPLRLSLSYLPGSTLNNIDDIISNRADFRLQWKYKFFQKIAVSIDAKLVALFENDQGLESSQDYVLHSRIRNYYIQTNGFFDFKLGYQVVHWSKMESMPILDQMSPWDYSEFIYTSRDEARVGQPAMVIDFSRSWGMLTLVVNPAAKTNIYPKKTLNYLTLESDNPSVIRSKTPQAFAKDDIEVGFRWLQKFGSSDVSLTLGHVLENEPVLVSQGLDQYGYNVIQETFPAFQMVGFSGNLSDGNFLWKAETAYNFNRMFNENKKKDSLDSGIGIEYSAKGYSINLEWVYNYILEGKGTELLSSLNQFTARWSKSFLNDAISAVYFSNYELETGSRLQSGALRFAINDFFKTEINVTVFDLGKRSTSLFLSDSFRHLALKLSAIF